MLRSPGDSLREPTTWGQLLINKHSQQLKTSCQGAKQWGCCKLLHCPDKATFLVSPASLSPTLTEEATHTHTRTHTHARTHTHTRTHASTHARTHTRTHTHAHTRTHTHTHTRISQLRSCHRKGPVLGGVRSRSAVAAAGDQQGLRTRWAAAITVSLYGRQGRG